MATAEVRLSATLLGLLTGNRTFAPAAALYGTAQGSLQITDLASGNNTITVPTGARAVLIVFPDTNTNTILLKGVNGDTGVSLARASWTFLNLRDDTPPASFVLTTSGAIAAVEFNWF